MVAFFRSLNCDIFISSFPKSPYALMNYPSLNTFEVRNCEILNMQWKLMIFESQYHFANISATKAQILMKFKLFSWIPVHRHAHTKQKHALAWKSPARIYGMNLCSQICAYKAKTRTRVKNHPCTHFKILIGQARKQPIA